jgi:hypothetical protein
MNRYVPTFLLIATLVSLPLVACSGDAQDAAPAQTAAPAQNGEPAQNGAPAQNGEPAPATEPTGAAEPAADPGLAPLTSRDEAPAELEGEAIAAPGLLFTLPASWEQEPPSSSMRLAQAQIPGPGGPGQLAVFFFGVGGGGGVESNLQRWIGQMESEGEPVRDTFRVGDFIVHWVEVAGTQKPSTMGMGPAEAKPGSTLLAAVVEGPGGPWFFKATGPTETLAAERETFFAMLRSIQSHG